MNKISIRLAVLVASLTVALGILIPQPLRAQSRDPRFEVDPAWPKPLPNLWVTGGIGGVCIDSRDHIFILNRRDLTDNDLDAGHQAPVVIEFDPEGNVVNSFGDLDSTPNTPHGCAVDADNNLWITGTGDGIVQEYSHDGSKLLRQIGQKGAVDSSDGTAKGKAQNSSHAGFFKPAGMAIDPKNGDVYVADGETIGGNHRVAVFDAAGKFLRQWDLHRTEAETGDAFIPVLHCVTLDNAGLVYVCDRRGHRIQVFDKIGNFQKNIPVEFFTPVQTAAGARACAGARWDRLSGWVFHETANRNTCTWLIRTTRRLTFWSALQAKLVSSFGRAGRQPGEFTYAHFLAVDSKGNIYVAEVGTGKRIQKFKLAGSR